jgi:hypothetical protein
MLSAWFIRRDQIAGKWLYASIVCLEGQRGRAALARSQVLVNRLGGTMGTGRVMPLLVLILLGAALLAMMLTWSWLHLFNNVEGVESLMFTTTATFGILLCLLLTMLFSPILAIAIALFYLKARQAGGETLDHMPGMRSARALPHHNW